MHPDIDQLIDGMIVRLFDQPAGHHQFVLFFFFFTSSDEQFGVLFLSDVYTDQKNFLGAIFDRFLENVHPIESGLMDDFRADGIMSSDEEHEIRAQVTRRDGARKMWSFLHRVPPDLFENYCYAAMKHRYSHLFNELSFCWDGQGDIGDQCLRHTIMTRMTMRRFADVFPSTKGSTLAEYWFVMAFVQQIIMTKGPLAELLSNQSSLRTQ